MVNNTDYISYAIVVDGFNPKNMSSSVGMIRNPIYDKNEIYVPNHQPD